MKCHFLDTVGMQRLWRMTRSCHLLVEGPLGEQSFALLIDGARRGVHSLVGRAQSSATSKVSHLG
jgi:hypothetical protein